MKSGINVMYALLAVMCLGFSPKAHAQFYSASYNLSYATLQGYAPSCNQSNATQTTGPCGSAVNRYCQALGDAGGVNLGAYSISPSNGLTAECFFKSGAIFFISTYSAMNNALPPKLKVPSCNSATPTSGPCKSLVSRYCQATGYTSGFGPVEYNGPNLAFVCTTHSTSTTVPTTFTALNGGSGNPNSNFCTLSNVTSTNCEAAAVDTCFANGYVGSGFGPVEASGNNAIITCNKLP